MDRIQNCQEKFEALFGGKPTQNEGNDPEFMRILQRFIFGEVSHTGSLDDKMRELITITVLTVNQTQRAARRKKSSARSSTPCRIWAFRAFSTRLIVRKSCYRKSSHRAPLRLLRSSALFCCFRSYSRLLCHRINKKTAEGRMEDFGVYEDIAARTGGEIYIGVVGPVRTGKSTFIKRFMEELVLPEADGAKKQRMRDELPQSASGKTVMTTEPKFVPEEAFPVTFGKAVANVRLVDCVGFPVRGAAGFEEDGEPRLVKTPWSDAPVPFEEAAEEGTRKVMRDHSTIGIVMTTDGSVTGIGREEYEDAEARCIAEMKEAQKPFVILLNCKQPQSAEELRASLEERYSSPVIAVNCEEMGREELSLVLERVLYEFPVLTVDIELPDWMRIFDADSPVVADALASIRAIAPKIEKMSDCALLDTLFHESERLSPPISVQLEPAAGRATVRAEAKEGAFYRVLGEMCGADIGDDFALMSYVASLGDAKKLYDRVGKAFEEAKECGYGIVPPEDDEMDLSEPKVVKKGGRVGVDLHAHAPSYHIIRVDLTGEVRPAIGNEEQSESFAKTLAENMATEPEAAWNTNMFGKTLKELLGDELYVKNRSMAENVQRKMRRTVTRIVNEGKGGVICILI